MIAALAGGVGAAKLLAGMAKVISPREIIVVGNTGDDIQLYGLHVSPDLDITAYSLAGIVDEAKGWGIRGDTFRCLDTLRQYTGFGWFNLGDRDLATHIFRTNLLKQNYTLTEVTRKICDTLGVGATILPMTDDQFETRIVTKEGTMHFEEYMVKQGAKDEILSVEFCGAENAKPAPGVTEAISEAERVVVCPSNPVVSIGTILSVKGIRDALMRTNAKVVGVSPIIGGLPVKGPADKLMRGLGYEVSAFGVAELYADFLDVLFIDKVDAAEKSRIEQLGVTVMMTDIVMTRLEDKIRLAEAVLQA